MAGETQVNNRSPGCLRTVQLGAEGGNFGIFGPGPSAPGDPPISYILENWHVFPICKSLASQMPDLIYKLLASRLAIPDPVQTLRHTIETSWNDLERMT